MLTIFSTTRPTRRQVRRRTAESSKSVYCTRVVSHFKTPLLSRSRSPREVVFSPSFSQHAAKHIEYESRVVCAYLFLRKQPPPAEKSSTATYLSKGSIRKIPQPLSLSLSHSLARSSRRLIFSHSRSGLLYVIYTPVLVGPIRVLPAL